MNRSTIVTYPPAGLVGRVPDIGFRATTGELFARSVARFGDQSLVVSDDGRMSYAEIDAAAGRLALMLLDAGVGKGTRVGAQFPYGADWVVVWLAVTRIGALFAPLSTAYKPAELAKVLRVADIHLLLVPAIMFGKERAAYVEEALGGLAGEAAGRLRLTSHPYLRSIWLCGEAQATWAGVVDTPSALAARPLDAQESEYLSAIEAQVVAADLAMVIYTSGTTSEPKGVVHTHGAMVRHCAALAHLQEFKQGDRIFAGMPFFWVGGICTTVMPAILVGATILCVDQFEVGRALSLMEREKATRIVAWLGTVQKIIQGWRAGRHAIPAMDDPVFSPIVPKPHSFFGMTETCSAHAGAGPESRFLPLPEGVSGTMGPPLPFIEHRFTDPQTGAEVAPGEEGVISVRGYNLMHGMVKRERHEVFDADGWYVTGDKGFIRDGLLVYTGRATDMIKTSGNNVAPAEVEQALTKFPGIREAHVMGIPDRERDESVAALLVAEGDAGIDTVAVVEQLRAQLSNYKVPRKFVVVREGEVPMLATGKPDRLAIRAMLEA